MLVAVNHQQRAAAGQAHAGHDTGQGLAADHREIAIQRDGPGKHSGGWGRRWAARRHALTTAVERAGTGRAGSHGGGRLAVRFLFFKRDVGCLLMQGAAM